MTPEFSIIIPSVAGSPTVQALIDYLLHTDMGIPPTEYEIIVVVDGGEPFVHPYDASKTHVQILSNHRYRGAAGARNTGALAAQGKYLWFLDDDIFPSAGAIEVFIDVWSILGDDIVLGITTNQLIYPAEYLEAIRRSAAGNFFSREYALLFTEFATPVQSPFVCSGSMVMRADLFRKVGGFRELPPRRWKDIGLYIGPEDIELSYRLSKAQVRLYFIPKVRFIAKERHLVTAKSLIRRAFIDGYGGRILWEETYKNEGTPLPPITNRTLDRLLQPPIGWWIGNLAYILHLIMEWLYRVSNQRIYFHKFLLLAKAVYALQGRRFAEREIKRGILSKRQYLYD